MKIIGIIGDCNVGIAARIIEMAQARNVAIVVVNSEKEQFKNLAFEREPFEFISPRLDFTEIKISDEDENRNRFFDKPKRNYKRK